MIDWRQLTRDVAFKLSADGRIWISFLRSMELDGIRVEASTPRGWANGRSVPRGDSAVWLYLKAKELGVRIRERQ